MDDIREGVRHKQTEGGDTVVSLLRQLTEQGTHLAHQQAELIRAEVSESVNNVKQGVGSMAGAAVVGIAGLGVLLMGLAFTLAEVMDLWLATLIVAAVTLLVALLMFLAGRKKMQSNTFDLDRSRRTLKRAPSAVTSHAEGAGNHE
jgi:hypothetical protein